MPDFVPEDMDEYIKRERWMGTIFHATDQDEVEGSIEQLGEWAVGLADALVANGIGPMEAVAGVSASVAATLAVWYRENADAGD